jgi:DNA invertase Pin-like site-specific DNA recombinase/TolA-binding protein
LTAAYARYSSDGQREESIDGQIRECREYAERPSMAVIGAYLDRAFSARTDERPEFRKMIRDSAKKQFDVVLVWKLDRFARSRADSATYRAILKRNGVNVVSAKENISEGPEGIILEAILEGMAEYYSAELSVKVKRGQKENALKCKFNGGTIPFGYRISADRFYEPDPVAAPIVLEIFTGYADGQTVKEITAAMKDKCLFAGIKYSYTNKSTLNNLLKNRRYIGEYRYGDTVTPDGMPAIVPREIFGLVQERMEKNKQKPAAMKADEEYILTTKLFCGKCGTMMAGKSGTSKTGKTHYYYSCGNVLYKKSCDKKAARKAWIERQIAALTSEFVLRDEIIDRLADAVVELQQRENTAIPFLQKQLDDMEKRIGNLINSIEEGAATASVKQRLGELEEAKADIEISIAREKIGKPVLTKEQIVFWISRFKGGDVDDPAYRKAVVDVFVNSVFLYDDKLVIAFNWKDGSKTVTLAELETAAAEPDATSAEPDTATEAADTATEIGNDWMSLSGDNTTIFATPVAKLAPASAGLLNKDPTKSASAACTIRGSHLDDSRPPQILRALKFQRFFGHKISRTRFLHESSNL